MLLPLSELEPKACPKCGAVLDEESIYCGSCGADLTSKTLDRAPDARVLKHRPRGERDEIFDKNHSSTSKKISRFTPGSEDSGEFDSSTFAYATYKNTGVNRYSRIALILGIFGMIFNGWLITLLGFNFLSRAEKLGEDYRTIVTARILLVIQAILQIGELAGLIYLVITLA